MEIFKLELIFQQLKTEDLSLEDRSLHKAAIHTALRAYAPYSHFKVGAAVLLTDGTIVEGNNQENAAYPSGLCAERVALFTAGATFPERPVAAIAIVATRNGIIQSAIAPCGACRQVMLETEKRYGQPMRILMCGDETTVIAYSTKDLLPLAFEL